MKTIQYFLLSLSMLGVSHIAAAKNEDLRATTQLCDRIIKAARLTEVSGMYINNLGRIADALEVQISRGESLR